MLKSAVAGLVYFLIVFLLGFGLGTLRVLLVAPQLGEFTAVLLEAPVMLVASWVISCWCVRRLDVAPEGARAGALMGTVAFTLLLSAELAVSELIFRRNLTDFTAGYRPTSGLIGLAAQFMFGFMPLLLTGGRAIPKGR